jgi:hypothetical protein
MVTEEKERTAEKKKEKKENGIHVRILNPAPGIKTA